MPEEKDTITKDDVGEVDTSEISDKLDELEKKVEATEGGGLKMESAKVELSGEIREVQEPNCADAVFAFASYISGVKTFKAGSRGDASKLAQHAADFCAENNWEVNTDDFPDNINYPE